ncbi:MAG: tRNA (adenosine(37)-N6)-threonylcarbamoyltransferase complex transferase subunit TsaD [Planctomycetota bacterium]
MSGSERERSRPCDALTATAGDFANDKRDSIMTLILGIETSCDETAAAVVGDGRDVRSNVVASQVDLHAQYGGVVPEIASRAHLECIDAVINEAFAEAQCDRDQIDAIAVTHRPGLMGALLVGLTAAKTLAWLWGKPLIAVDHIHAHAFSPALATDSPPWPAVALVVSGGHTSLYRVNDPCETTLLGATVDDAAGEAFDKVSAILALGYPGGPAIQRASEGGDPSAVDFPRTMLKAGSLDFSFSGIKTAVLYKVHGHGKTSGGLERLSPAEVSDIAASFQQAVVDVLVRKTMTAAKREGVSSVVIGGGVAANRCLRESMSSACAREGMAFHAAPMSYCTDNGAMIAGLGFHLYQAGVVAPLDIDAFATGM